MPAGASEVWEVGQKDTVLAHSAGFTDGGGVCVLT